MLKLKIISVGKTKEQWLEDAFQEYTKRLKNQVSVECLWARNDEHLIQLVEKEPYFLCLDPSGKMMDSYEFAQFFQQQFEKGGARLSLVIGGAEGLPEKLRKHPHPISLSTLTMTHQIVRLVLIEQIYRAFEILKGSPYHK